MADQVCSGEPSSEELFQRYAVDRDPLTRDLLIARHTYLVEVVAKKFSGMGESSDDLVQEGTLGLINAVDMFDVGRGVKFSTYATHLIAGQIQHYLRDKGKLIRQPAWVQEMQAKITKATEALTQELGQAPTNAQIAARLGISETSVTELLKARERTKVASLDIATDQDGDGPAPALNPDKINSVHLAALPFPIEDRITLQEAIDSRLKDLERKVVRYFFYYDLNQTEIARKLEISVNYASYLLRGAVNKLRATFEQQARDEAQAVSEREAPVARGRRPDVTPARPAPGGALPNADYLRERLAQDMARAARYPQQFSLMLIRLDVKSGAVVPPALCQAVGALLRRNTRAVDVVARMAAGHYALLLPHTGKECRILAERLLQRIAGTDWSAQAPAQPQWTASAGYALYPQDGTTEDALLKAAERALAAAAGLGNSAGGAPAQAKTR